MEILRQAARLFGHKNKQYETLTEITAQGAKVRIWRSAKSIEAAKAFNHTQFAQHIRSVTDSLPQDHWEAALMRLPNVACVAIVDANGNGVSSYPDWH